MPTPAQVITWMESQEFVSIVWDGAQWIVHVRDSNGTRFSTSAANLSDLIDDTQVKVQAIRDALNPGA